MIDQINELKSQAETSHYIENTWISRKKKKGAREICEMCVYKHLETIEYVKKAYFFMKCTHFTGK